MRTHAPEALVTDATSIGLVADNHSANAEGADLPSGVLEAFADVGLVIHCGDSGDRGALDRLEEAAPVVGVTGDHNPEGEDPRIRGATAVVRAGRTRIGVVHHIEPAPGGRELAPSLVLPHAAGDYLADLFGGPIDVLAIAGSHEPYVVEHDGVLIVNPGSPTLPAGPDPRPTVAVLSLAGPTPTARIVALD